MSDDNIISVKPNPSPEPNLDNLRLITARNLPAAQLVAAVRAAGFEVRSFGPAVHTYPLPAHSYVGECLLGGRWYGVATETGVSDDEAFQAGARLIVEVAAIHRAAEGDT